MQALHRKSFLPVFLGFTLIGAPGCGSDGSAPETVAPRIALTGVAPGQTYQGPVTISISIDRGSYTATVDGQPFSSGQTVSVPGPHTLAVTARNGTATSDTAVAFAIAGGDRALTIRLLDLGANASGGGGDAILLTDSSSAGKVHAMIDAGPAGANASDPSYVSRRLAALGVDSLEFLQLTHAHADHYQGMNAIFSVANVKRFIYNGQVRNLSSYNTLVGLARGQADSMIVPTTNYVLNLGAGPGAARITVVAALASYLGNGAAESAQLNEGSLGTALELGTFRMFFTGDGEVEANARWRTQFADLSRNVTVLKVGHHGANDAVFDNGFSGNSSWLNHTAPAVSVISSNGTTHPRVNALTRLLQQNNNRTYCTSVHGEITIRVLPAGTYQVAVQKNATMDCVPGSDATS